MKPHQLNRRDFLRTTLLATVASAGCLNIVSCTRPTEKGLIAKIENSIIWPGRTKGKTWFHPRACMIPAEPSPVALMTCQDITGSDVFSQVHWASSSDNGYTWTDPEPITSLAWETMPDGIEEGTCDVVPDYHPKTKTVLAIGHNVYYRDRKLARAYQSRYPVYVTRDATGNWSDRKKLEWDHPETTGIYTCGCAQRITLKDGRVLLPLSFGAKERKDRKVCTVLCSYDGEELKILQSGNELELAVKRGLLEPTLARYKKRFFMTIRAEDGFGYITLSDDGLLWEKQRPWCWENGEPLTMSTTQQRWLVHSHGLFLVYTRKAENNVNVMRWRSPLFVAQVDTDRLCLIRNSERVVFPLIGDGINNPDHVARMGNFHVVNASENESWVTVGETLPSEKWKGNTLLGRLYWNRPNMAII